MIIDRFGRVHDYLRISVTDNCDLRCTYCMPEEQYQPMGSSKLMSTDEIVALAALFVKLGVKKIRLTGGEPFVRKDIGEIIRRISELNVTLAITTNGTRLHEYIDVIRAANIKAVNVSLDTLNAQTFQYLTKRDRFVDVHRNIESLLDEDMQVKVNMVVMKGINDGELLDFVRWTISKNLHVRFIEFMPFSGNQWEQDKVFTLQDILNRIAQEFEFNPVSTNAHDTAKTYKVVGSKGDFSVISTMTAPFCAGCNRIRLTADGKLKNCLFSKSETDLLTAFRSSQDVEQLILDNVYRKEKELGGQFSSDMKSVQSDKLENRTMIAIGG